MRPGLLTIPAQVPSIHDPTGARGVLHVEYPLVVRLGPGRPPRMVQRRFRDFDKLEKALAPVGVVVQLRTWALPSGQ